MILRFIMLFIKNVDNIIKIFLNFSSTVDFKQENVGNDDHVLKANPEHLPSVPSITFAPNDTLRQAHSMAELVDNCPLPPKSDLTNSVSLSNLKGTVNSKPKKWYNNIFRKSRKSKVAV